MKLSPTDSRQLPELSRPVYLIRVAVIFCCGLLPPALVYADLRDSFETALPSWRLAEADCVANITQQSRTFSTAHSGSGCEFVQIKAENGTRVYLSLDISPASVISELGISLWVKADRPGIQLMARVVLPRSTDKNSDKPLMTFLRGTSYDRVGQWQLLQLTAVDSLLRNETFVLRNQFGRHVDTRQAYIDKIVLNAHGGSRITNLYLDDLEVSGLVTLPEFSEASGATSALAPSAKGPATESSLPNSAQVQLLGAKLLVAGRPFLPRAVQYHDEEFAWLKAIGFNVIQLDRPATDRQMAEARRLDLWLIAPPPTTRSDAARSDRILAWKVPAGQEMTANWVDLFEASDRSVSAVLRRPLIWNIETPLRSPEQAMRVVLHERFSATGPRASSAHPGMTRWMEIDDLDDLDRPNPWDRPERGQPALSVRRRAVIHAIASGARGFVFASAKPISETTETSRIAELRALNNTLALLEPWLAGGAGTETLSTEKPHEHLIAIPTDRSRLLIFWQDLPATSTKAPPLRSPRTLVDTGSNSSTEAYQVLASGLRPLRRQRVSGGMRLEIESADNPAFIVCTQDALVLNYLAQRAPLVR